MASIERTAYPRFKTSVSARELFDAFTPSSEEIEWAAEATRHDDSQLTLLVLLKSVQRLGYFPNLSDVPADVAAHVARGLSVGAVAPLRTRTLERYRVLVRSFVGVMHDPAAVRKLIADTIEVEARTKDNPADLINVALGELVKARYELPGYSTLDRAASTIRANVNQALFTEPRSTPGTTTCSQKPQSATADTAVLPTATSPIPT